MENSLYSEIALAICHGYDASFLIQSDGSFLYIGNPNKKYSAEDILVEKVVISISPQSTLYLVSTRDGLYKGTAVEFWESGELLSSTEY